MIIELDGVSKFYITKKTWRHRNDKTVKAINGLSLTIERGELLGYLGVNGAGKSTTIKLLSGILAPTSGTIKVMGKDPFKYRKQNVRHLGVVFGQKSQLIWDLPPIDTFNLFSKIYDINEKDYKMTLDFLMDCLNIHEFAYAPVRKLSLGQRMCCEIIAALLHKPDILFLDEPTIGLDVLNKERVRNFIKSINKEFKTTVLLTTHDLDDVEELCNRIVIVDKGTKRFDGSISQLKEQYGAPTILEVKLKTPQKPTDIMENTYDIEVEENRIVIKFDKNKVDPPEVFRMATATFKDIVDISLYPTGLETVLKGMYKSM